MNNDTASVEQATPVVPEPATPAKPTRLMSLDALRGFDMFWIVGGDALVKASARRSPPDTVSSPIRWSTSSGQGFHFEDLIFPMFVFIVGGSLVFSTGRTIEQYGRRAAVSRIIRRALLYVSVGIFYYGGFSRPLEKIRLLGVLQRIAICYLFAGPDLLLLRPAWRVSSGVWACWPATG